MNIIPREHHRFRSLHGTVTASIEMQIQVVDALEEGYIVTVVFIDVRAGFNTVPHSFLLRKVQMIGYPESTLD